jgi:prolipoprotein diacylglyceryltransferase
LWNIRKIPWKDGFVFCLYLLLYSVVRFFVSFFRADSLMLGSFRMAQLASIALIIATSGFIYKRRLWQKIGHAEDE